MIDLHYWPTPNGHKITIFLEEAGLPYTIKPVNLTKGEQFAPDFLRISPNNRMPAIVDHAPADGTGPLSVFESSAILEYLGEKTGRFLPLDLRLRYEVLQWLAWAVSGLGPMLRQNQHFSRTAPERIPYAIDLYLRETARLYRVLNTRLRDRPYLAGEYSIADMACHPWIKPYERQGQRLEDYPGVKDWFERMSARPAVERAYAIGKKFEVPPELTPDARKYLYGPDSPAGDLPGR